MRTDALNTAIKIAGGQKSLADKIGTTQSQVWYWLNKSKKGVPGEYSWKIEAATEGAVKASELRPDIFGARAA